jgi:inosine-uridine nucleoside N-ribohydrolase
MTKKLIVDTDPGVDDTIAICTALRSPDVSVIGLTSVFGNAPGEITAQNALRLVELEGHGDIPVARGSDTPLVFPLEKLGTWVHGEDGMGNAHPPAPKGKLWGRSAAEFIVETVRANPGEVTLVPVGPLTNLALALRIDPGIAELVREVVIMGGVVAHPGNMTPVAEANLYHDPHAGDVVLSAGWPVVLVGLDVTHKTVITPAFWQEVYKADNPSVNLIQRILPCYQSFFDKSYGLKGAIYTHDPSAVAYVIHPELFKTQSVPVFVETEGRCVGQTVADWSHQWESRPEVKVCMDVDSQGVLALIKECLTR